jgi:hypothetical protein
MFQITKVATTNLFIGPVTNLICANRPISQYGLSYNNKVSNLIVKQFKKSNAPYTNQRQINTNKNNCNCVEEFIDESLEKQEILLDFYKIQQDTSCNIKTVKKQPSHEKVYEEEFLQRKLAEAYLLLKNK